MHYRNAAKWLAALPLGLMLYATPALADHDEATVSQGPTGNVRDLITDLYGGNGITLDPQVVFHSAHFAADSQEKLNDLANVIASNVGTFTFNSTVSGVSFDIEEGVPVRSQESLGPLLAERATTIGKGRINLGVSYTNIMFKQLDGRDLNDLSITLAHDQEFGVPYEQDVIVLDLDLNLKQQVVAFIATYGVTDSLDIGFVAPLIRIEGSVRSTARIIDNGGGGIHAFGGTVSPISSNRASATGIGDMVVRAKWELTEGRDSWLDAGILLQGTLATGDEDDLLGTGSNAVYLGGILSADFGKINPHINLGYEYFIDQNNGGGLNIDRSNARGVVGFDIKARDNFAVSSEVLARWEKDGDHFYDFAVGTKWAPVGDVPISANIVVPLNRNEGLRPNFYFTLGIEATF
jgi:hypothetical protein